MIVFGDGILEEHDSKNELVYSIETKNMSDKTVFDHIELGRKFPYELPLERVEKKESWISLCYKKTIPLTLLSLYKRDTKKKKYLEQRDQIAAEIILMSYEQYQQGFFVLPIPENFFVSEDKDIYLLYKATKEQPITGFDFSQLFTHVKRLIAYLYSEYDFKQLIATNKIPTDSNFLLELSNQQNFEQLYYYVTGQELVSEQEVEQESEEEVQQSVTTLEKKAVESSIEMKINEGQQKPPTLSSKKFTLPKKPIPPKPVVIEKYIERPAAAEKKTVPKKQYKKQEKEPNKRLKRIVVGGIGFAFLLSITMNAFMIYDKVTYPTNINFLKKDNESLQENIEKTESKNTKLKEENQELKETNSELEKELDTNVKVMKELVAKNDELQKELKKGK